MTGAQTILLTSVEDGAVQNLAACTVTGEMGGDECLGGDYLPERNRRWDIRPRWWCGGGIWPCSPRGPQGSWSAGAGSSRGAERTRAVKKASAPLQRGPGGWRNGLRQRSEAGVLLPELLLSLEPGNQQRWKNKGGCCLVIKSCPTLYDPTDCSPPGSSVHGISQVRTLGWVAMSSSRGSSRPRDWTGIYLLGKQILCHWATLEVPEEQSSVLELQPGNAVLWLKLVSRCRHGWVQWLPWRSGMILPPQEEGGTLSPMSALVPLYVLTQKTYCSFQRRTRILSCLKDLMQNYFFSAKSIFKFPFLQNRFKWWKIWWCILPRDSSSVFLRLKEKKRSTTTSTFQPWKVSNKHGLKMFFIIFSSLLWMTVIACPKKVRKQRNVRGSLFLSVAVSPALALDLLWCQCKCKCHYNVSVRFLPLLLSVSIRCLMLP